LSDKTQGEPKLPEAPEIERKLQISRLQWIGMPLIMLIPLLAIFGFFGESFRQVSAASTELDLQINYPTRTRYAVNTPLAVNIRNISAQAMPTVTLRFDQAYVERFSDFTFKPALTRVSAQAYEVELNDVAPGETRRVMVDLKGDQYGRQQGIISASTAAGAAVQTEITTWIFP
jgi:hypothetical protein